MAPQYGHLSRVASYRVLPERGWLPSDLYDFCRVPLPFESMRTSPFSMSGTWLILIWPVRASRRSVLEIVVTVSQRVLSWMLLERIMLRICLFSRLSFLLLCGIISPLTLFKGSELG